MATPNPDQSPAAQLENRIPPVILFFLAFAVQQLLPRPKKKGARGRGISRLAATGVVGGALVLVMSAVRKLGENHTTVDPMEPTDATTLVTDGPYSLTRNPIYLSMAIALAGGAIWKRSVWAIVPVALFVAVLTRLQIIPEERAMQFLFGDDYEQYTRDVRRWV
ncbi:methyltransferase family protein [Propionibacteriaceae bacterium G57]|uniref:methyltransferase family protein n=1 Tax=Aestuariimicrobium sp. G57 TaxID=3418485 RepID=UPI003DA796A2